VRSGKLKALFPQAVLVAGAFVGGIGFTLHHAATGQAPPVEPTIILHAQSGDQEPVMLADEIIRRLRRLGWNFTKNRISRPYDPYGEIC